MRSVVGSYSLNKILANGGALAFLIKLANAGLQFLVQIVLARMLGANEFGSYMLAIAWVNVLMILGKLGYDTAALRYVSAYIVLKDWGRLVGFLNSAYRVVFCSSVTVGALFAIFLTAWSGYLDKNQYLVLLVAMILVPLLSLMLVLSAILRGMGSIVRSLSPFSIIRHLFFIGFILFGYFYGIKLTVFQALNFTSVSAFLALAIIIYWLRNLKNKIIIKCDDDIKPNYETRNWLVSSLPMMGISGFQILLSQGDIIIVNMMRGSNEGGVYAAMSQLSLLLALGHVSINTVAAPLIAKFYAVNEKVNLQKIIKETARLSFIVTFIGAVILMIFGEWIIRYYGEEFIKGYPILTVLIVAQLISAMAGSVAYLMAMTGHQNFLLKVTGAFAFVNLILNICFVPYFGSIAAAYITAVTMAMLNFALAFYSYKRLGIRSTAIGL